MSNFTSFLKNNYNTTFNTKRSGESNDITKINFCIVNNINPFLFTPIRDFELIMPQGCYSSISNKLDTSTIGFCLSSYIKDYSIPDYVKRDIVDCINPTTTTTTTV